MKKILSKLYDHQKLSTSEAYEVLTNISKDQYNNSQVASFMTVFLMRTISVEELIGFRQALLDLCRVMDLGNEDLIDLCGTGGDGKDTFNISTLASFIVAGAGYKVAKHGNSGVSSISGSSNVLQELGYKFTNSEDDLKRQLDAANICFMHAPLFHPALKGVGPIRRELGVKTFFNMLGPLVNPAQPKHQSVGVFSLKLGFLYKYLHETLDKKYCIVYSLDGYDEVSLTSDVKLIKNEEEIIAGPEYFGFKKIKQSDIYGGGSIAESAAIFRTILENKGTAAQNNVVLANAACAIQCFDQSKSIVSCVAEAKESLSSGKALESLNNLVKVG